MKREFNHSLVLAFIFLLAVGVVFYYSDLKFTGYDVSEGETTSDSSETSSDSSETTETTEETTESTETEETTEETTESSETETTETEELAETTENNEEVLAENNIEETNDTDQEEIICTPNWECGDWGSCSDGNQLRTCTDSNSCDSEEGMPVLTQSCTYCGDNTCDGDEDCDECPSDCGSCNSETEEEEEESSGGGAVIPTTTLISSTPVQQDTQQESVTCTPNWICGEWGECVISIQVRECTDSNSCDSEEGMPETIQDCIIEATCSDKIMNQDENGVDCGGVCENKCGFVNLMGSAISDSIEVGKNFIFEGMFGNITSTIISISILVVIVGGFITLRFFIRKSKGIKRLDKAIDELSDNPSED